MSSKRLSFDAFKTKVENVNTNEVLEKIQGGTDFLGCHGFWGQMEKALDDSNTHFD